MTKQEFLNRAKAINVKESRGHDAPSYEWDIKFDNVKVCNCWDDSYGGELEINNYSHHSIEKIYSTIDKDSLWDEKYQWTTTLELLMSELLDNHYRDKDAKKGVVFTNGKIRGYKHTIPTLIKRGEGFLIQDIIDSVKDKSTIVNHEYLTNLKFKI
tara:strand:- start:2908 stop:3375 length:468 start_codon:yes stop_codon:yes gene_type:complete